MTVDQLPDQVREFADYLDGLLARLDGGGWYGVFWQRDPDGMRACLDGREVPPWDVVEALLQDVAAEHGPAAAAGEEERARALHAAALIAHDRLPGGREALGDRLDVMLREQKYAAERVAALTHALATATGERSESLRVDLAWAHDDHARATARCAELRRRTAALDLARGPDTPYARLPEGRTPQGGRGRGPRTGYGRAPGDDDGRTPRGGDGAPEEGAGALPGPGGAQPGRATGSAPSGPGPSAQAGMRPGRGDEGTPSGSGLSEPGGTRSWEAAEGMPSGSGVPESGRGRPGRAVWRAPSGPETPELPVPGPRKRRRGGARFAGAGEEEGAGAVPEVVVPEMPGRDGNGRRTPRGARFAGVAQEPRHTAAPPRAEGGEARAGGGEPRAEIAGVVRTLAHLRGEGRSGEAHALLAEAAHWPAARLPALAGELERAGLGADWATLLWEAASLPADRLVDAADALAGAGRDADGQQILRQGVVRPAGEVGRAVVALEADGRHRDVRALLDAYVRVRTPEEAARSAAEDPPTLVPLLLEAAEGVSGPRYRDLLHALRVAGLAA
ncbi:hypothetical protein [Streptomyces sp. NPDC093094]|uniref:hypothetical protein n=1 Tax=Streptomyces sp. NPDC093094 TaxID=3366026 RepID=UPI003805E2CC